MQTIVKQKWIVLLLVLLLLTNIATLVFLWVPGKLRSNKLPPGPAFEILVKELKMTAQQQAEFTKMKDEHQQAVKPYREQLRNAKDKFFKLLNNDTASQETIEHAAAAAALPQRELDIITFQHFKKLRAICTPVQKNRFDEIIQDVIRQMGQQPGRPGNHPGPPQGPPGEGPPGPPGERPAGPPGDQPPGPQGEMPPPPPNGK